MTASHDPTRPFERDAFFDEPGIVGARWWNRSFQAEVAASRRQALKIVAVFVAGGAAVLGAGVAGVAAVVAAQGEPRLRKAVDVQREIGWSAGSFDTPLFTASSEPIPAGALERVTATLKPRRYAPFFVGTQLEAPFATPRKPLGGAVVAPLQPQLRRNRTATLESDMRAGADLARIFAVADLQTLVVIDAPGPRSAAFAAGAAGTFEPVLVLDNWPHPAGVVLAQQTLGALAAFEQELAAGAARRGPAPPPLFVLDRERTAPLVDPEAQFDNRYMAVLPQAKVAVEWRFKRALLIVETETKLPEAYDVAESFAAYAAAGMETRCIGLDLFDWSGAYAAGKASFFHHHPWAPVPAGRWDDRGLSDKYRSWRPSRYGTPPSNSLGKVMIHEKEGAIIGIDAFGGTRDRASGGWGG